FGTPADGDLSSTRPDVPARPPLFPEAARLVRDRVAQRLIAVQVLDLALRRPHRLAVLLETDRDVHIEPARAFLETHLRHAREHEDITMGAHVRLTSFWGAHVR